MDADDSAKPAENSPPAPPNRAPAGYVARFRPIVASMSVTLILIFAAQWIEGQRWGRELQTMAYEALQTQIPAFDRNAPPAVVVVDISKIPGGIPALPISRQKLDALVQAIAKSRPMAIGIDVDFSPNLDGSWMVSAGKYNDPWFLNRCLDITRGGVPVYLGVYRWEYSRPDDRLGRLEYAPMAVSMGLDQASVIRIPRAIAEPDYGAPISTLSGALASAYDAAMPGVAPAAPWWRSPLIEHEDVSHGSGGYPPADLVNYSKVEALQRETLLTISPESASEFAARFKDRLVIIGRAASDETTDLWQIPGRDSSVPGAYLHAAAVDTFVCEPQYELKPLVRMVIDVLLSLCALLAVAYVRRLHSKDKHFLDAENLPGRYLRRAAIAVVVIGFVLVRAVSVMWLDFILVAFALLLHRTTEEVVDRAMKEVHEYWKKIATPADTPATHHDNAGSGPTTAESVPAERVGSPYYEINRRFHCCLCRANDICLTCARAGAERHLPR
jgi:CHASE2 domain-containing sensor protein